MTATIVVCSKGRPEKCPTIRALEKTDLDWFVMLEQEDYAGYTAAGLDPDRIVVLEQSGQGIAYTRRAALSTARKLALEWVWMLDDDITKWFRVIDKRVKPCTMEEALAGAEQYFIDAPNVAIGALEYQQIAWSSDKPFKSNGYCDVAVCVNLKRTLLFSHRDYLAGKEDRDFAMQALANGFETRRVQAFAFGCPPIGTNAGGLDFFYKQRSNVQRACDRMLETWGPQVITIVEKKNGMPDAKIKWKALTGQSAAVGTK